MHEKVVPDKVVVHYLPIGDQLADRLTKPLSSQRFVLLHRKLVVATAKATIQGQEGSYKYFCFVDCIYS